MINSPKKENTEKRVLKTEPKLNVTLNEEQKEFVKLFYQYDVLFLHGDFGSGKSLAAVHTALTAFRKKQFNNIWITRPMLKNSLAALPGAQPYSSKILTPNGWTTMGEIVEGDIVYASDGSEVKVLGTYEHGERDVFEITTLQNRKTKTCDKHLWEVQESNYKRKYNKPKLVDTTYIKENLINDYGGLRFSIPKNDSVKFYEKSLELHPYVMGCLLGDGSSAGSIRMCNVDQELLDRFNELIKPLGCSLTKPKDNKQIGYYIKSSSENNKPGKSIKLTNVLTSEETVYNRIGEALKVLDIKRPTLHHRCEKKSTIDNIKYEFIEDREFSTNPVKNILEGFNLNGVKSYDKFIPDIYKLGSYEQRVELLRGLLDTDGNIKKNGEVNFSTTSKKLADDITEVVYSLGGKVHMCVRDRRDEINTRIGERDIITRRISYQIGISFSEYPDLFYISRKKERIKKYSPIHKDFIKTVEFVGKERVKCIKIDHPRELYITDDYIVTHNTLEEKMSPYTFPITQNMEVCQGKEMTDKMLKEGLVKIMPIEVAKGCSFIDSVVIVDEYEDMSYSDFRTILTRLSKGSKMIFCGSKEQIDKQIGKNSCIYETMKLETSGLVGYITLKANHRNPVLTDIIAFLENK